ncbi:methyltransferase domain-containing protein [Pediococcus cellicola]|uniref:Rrna large subunit methyltransferase a n=1 Tax=Pediococcus cellicola TaxID=319652 RepID=A0A0R2IJZ5_9LACO|nr:methyltransferase domain-containing protein [Pediococcus cellicola]KRN65337.1 rrna large subunit methyltransferase a [Pediococcus cellicola]GEL15753.1 23S rRNA methyltransferase [Pediococcus cellicola]
MKKREKAIQFVKQHLNLFRCPVCQQGFVTVENGSVRCPNQHSIDIAKKGTLYFLNHAVKSEYDAEMLASRRRILTAGLFDPICQVFAQNMQADEIVLDVGSGEGTPLQKTLSFLQAPTAIGFDISTAGINLATQLMSPAFFCVADLANLPFNNDSFTTILDLFSPSAYAEFHRVLKPGAQVLKVVPNADYLVELRHLLYDQSSQHAAYENDQVVELFEKHFPNSENKRIRYTFEFSPQLLPDLIQMTPLHWGASQATIEKAKNSGLTHISVDVTLLKGVVA